MSDRYYQQMKEATGWAPGMPEFYKHRRKRMSTWTDETKQEAIDKTIALFEEVELPRPKEIFKSYPHQLSGGQKQRICIARALAAEPELIICDEVTYALDQIVQEGILKLLLKLQQDLDITYIFITHDIATVKAISDEIVVMLEGKVVEQGMKDKIFSPPYPEYTELLLSSVPEMDPEWLTGLLEKRANK